MTLAAVVLIARANYNQRSGMTISIRPNLPAQRLSAFALSCGLHAVWLSLALLDSPVPEPHQRTYTLTMLPPRVQESEHIIWYSRPDRLPPVSSGENARNPPLLAAQPERKQTITSSPEAPEGKLFIWVPDAPAQRQNPPDLPNMLVMAQSKPAPRKFEAPNPTRPAPADVAVPLPPEMRPVPPAAAARLPFELGSSGTAPRRPLRAFDAPKMRPSAPVSANLPVPPETQTARPAAGLAKLPPGLEAATAPPRRPLRQFEPPPERTATSVATPKIAEPPALTTPAGDRSVSAAVVSLDWMPKVSVVPPVASHEARIAVGPAQPAHTEGKLSGTTGAVRIANLGVRGSSPGHPASHDNSISELPASTLPPAATGVAAGLAPRPPYQATSSVSAPQWPGSRTVPPVVEDQFRGRVVFKTILTFTSSDDCVLWFGDREPVQPGSRLFMRPPVALEPAGDLPGSVSPRQPVVLSGILTADGRLTDLTALAGPATLALVEALGASRFTPAMRNGRAVEVTVVLEVTGVGVGNSKY